MGKGGGCMPSKNKPPENISSPQNTPLSHTQLPIPSISLITDSAAVETKIKKKLKIFIVFYSMYKHVEILAKKIKKGVDCVEGIEGILYRVPEILSPEILSQMNVPSDKDDAIPIISVEKLVEADGFLFGFPTRYGSMAAQMKAFFDSTGGLWREQKLAGVPAGIFVSTGTQGGGQETTAWTAITQLAHHGMLYVPIGYTFGSGMFNNDTIRGGSPYGAGVISGDGTREPTQTELSLAEYQGKYMSLFVKRYSY
ncbi:hypothetical protein ABFS83_14G111800 [Erythranthe nasuta]